MEYKDLTPEQKEQVKACKSPEELLALAKDAGMDISDDELASMSGGWELPCVDDVPGCPYFIND